MNKEVALENLVLARDVLTTIGLNYFIIDGTLLGAIRDKDFIPHDDDLDMGVFMEEWDLPLFAKVFEAMMRKGFILYHSFGKFGENFEVAWYRKGIKLDFFFYYKEGDKRKFNAFLNGGRTLPDDIITYSYDDFLIEDLILENFKGEYFNIPIDAGKVLVAKYGENWKIPDKRWNWATSPKNLESIGKARNNIYD